MKKLLLPILLIGLLFNSLRSEISEKENLILLSNDKIEVGVLPEVGGRVVLLRKPGLKNILKSNQEYWDEAPEDRIEPSSTSEFKSYFGHIVWLGPQSEWWQHQDLNKQRKKSQALWPPDPYLIYGNYKIIEKTDNMIKMKGPDSPISGVKLTKTISIDPSGKVDFKVEAQNIREKPVKWDLWMNTRVRDIARCYVPIQGKSSIKKFNIQKDDDQKAVPHKISKDYFTFLPQRKEEVQIQKAYIYPEDGVIYGFDKGQMLKISFDRVDSSDIHPEQGHVELYNKTQKDNEEGILELEVHGKYQKLEPGETMSLSEQWELKQYQGKSSITNHIDYIESGQ